MTTTLEQELLQAADDADETAAVLRSHQRDSWAKFAAKAARLRQRAARVRELLEKPYDNNPLAEAVMWSTSNYETYRGDNLRETLKRIGDAITGPIPSETAPAAEPPPRPTIAELEEILASPERDYAIEVLPNGEVRARRKPAGTGGMHFIGTIVATPEMRNGVPYCGGCDGGCALCRSNPPVESTGKNESSAAPKEGTVKP